LIKRLAFLVVLALGGAWVVRNYLIEGVYIASGSMEPTLPVGGHYLVNKLAFHLGAPKRGEIIVFRSPVDQQKGMVKRVIAVPGDTIELRDKQVLLNGAPLSEPYAVYKRRNERLVGDNIEPLKVPDNSYFVMGDNRDESDDSTEWRDPATGKPIYFVTNENLQGRLIIL
jgi:signal peptidase I